MLVFTEQSTSSDAIEGGATFAIVNELPTKESLPFEEYVVVAGQLASNAQRQLTCISGRVRAMGTRMLLVLPLITTDTVQIMDVGEEAVKFAQDVRGCFPMLVRQNPLSYASDSDDEEDESDNSSGNSSDEEYGRRHHRNRTKNGQKKRKKEEFHLSSEVNQLSRDVVEYMASTRVKMLNSWEELRSAYPVPTDVSVQAALSANGMNHQLLCVSLPAWTATTNTTDNASEWNFGVMFSHVPLQSTHLYIPTPRIPHHDEAAAVEPLDVYQDATVLSFGARRESTAHGGGKTPEEMVANIRMRHASGTFCKLILPVATWEVVRTKYASFLPFVLGLQGDLRLRRLVGVAPNHSVELRLETIPQS